MNIKASAGTMKSLLTFRLQEHQTLMLALLVVITAAMFSLTTLAARFYRAHEQALAQQWFDAGAQALAAGQPEPALLSLRTAMAYSRSSQYRLELAQALMKARRYNEARAYLLNIWEQRPGDAVVNLNLARLARENGNLTEAEDYYHDSIYGVWQVPDPMAARRDVRFELIDLLLQHHDNSAATAELAALVPNLPRDPAMYARVAALYLEAGNPQLALGEYRKALDLDSRYAPALAGAGQIEFHAAHYEAARHDLERAVRLDPQASAAQQTLDTVNAVLRLDPFLPRLSTAERARRTVYNFSTALSRLRTCARSSEAPPPNAPPTSELESLLARAQALQPVRASTLRRDPDTIYPIMDWVSATEDATARTCGAPTGPDLALVLISREVKHNR